MQCYHISVYILYSKQYVYTYLHLLPMENSMCCINNYFDLPCIALYCIIVLTFLLRFLTCYDTIFKQQCSHDVSRLTASGGHCSVRSKFQCLEFTWPLYLTPAYLMDLYKTLVKKNIRPCLWMCYFTSISSWCTANCHAILRYIYFFFGGGSPNHFLSKYSWC